ncbi:phosphoribosylanthranilate isomerase TRP1 NDAI_0G01570 [Naumovozyma dairenensis CBS 421]|uniref:N-(5'-phosphoribosyl)anthranilate isomerase n=1 Tax=Naumovozyma dairenensis (strain ATCC 10597 / BCRC 20456 / CBS 421 / NBRC 0211 / NRRL Y-12639) TaxID=1071378 RepID=G0WDS2_NAUDC|nr:hypothetical protein NDAI_0G01570 [Naumovozyma dairenensis CBS 421]CCD25933.2 hypothetical protein NDAI_0G01570 [Naumovozyma dairenensis CBS 421]
MDAFTNLRKDGIKPIIKICGIQTEEAAKCAINSGTNLLGIICVPNRKRTIMPDIARSISSFIHDQDEKQLQYLVGVFRNQSKEDVSRIVEDYGIDIVQLHGDEDWEEYYEFLQKPIIKRMIFPRDCDDVIQICNSDNKLRKVLPLFDSEAGGTGDILDWNAISQWAKNEIGKGNKVEYILTGGLVPENVQKAVSLSGVIGADVSGGVETDEVKDMEKIKSFIANGKQ